MKNKTIKNDHMHQANEKMQSSIRSLHTQGQCKDKCNNNRPIHYIQNANDKKNVTIIGQSITYRTPMVRQM